MGYIRHHAIVVTHWDSAELEEARGHAIALGLPCSEPVESTINRYVSFLIAPDGSKEGWVDSNEGDTARAEWVQFAESKRYEDGSIGLKYVLVKFGADEPENDKAEVQASSD